MWRTATWPDSGAAMWTSPPTSSRRVLDVIVEYGGLDGVHMTNVATVDGLEPDRYFKQVGQLTDCARS